MTQKPHQRVHAFIDAQNVYQQLKEQGWQYDLFKFRQYLRDKHKVSDAFFFIGYIAENKNLYTQIQKAGFILQFKEVTHIKDGTIKGNVDVNLTLHAATTIDDYDKAILVSADGDFYPLVVFWKDHDRALLIISPAPKDRTSGLLKKHAAGHISYMPDIRAKIEREK